METVIAQLVLDPEEDGHAAGHPGGQAGDIDDGVTLLLVGLAQGQLDVVPD